MALKDEILETIKQFPGQTDTELEKRFKKRHQQINIACRDLESKGLLKRVKNPDKNDLLGNYPTDIQVPAKNATVPMTNSFDEDAVKLVLKNWLESQGWSVKVAWGKEHGVDLEAINNGKHWLIEAKGPGSLQAMGIIKLCRVFLSVRASIVRFVLFLPSTQSISQCPNMLRLLMLSGRCSMLSPFGARAAR